jgi:hypothetical protein
MEEEAGRAGAVLVEGLAAADLVAVEVLAAEVSAAAGLAGSGKAIFVNLKTNIAIMKRSLFFLPVICILFSCNSGKETASGEGGDSTGMNAENPMTHEEREMKEMMEAQKNAKPQENPYKDAKIDIQVFNNDTVKQEPKLSGFGYNILIYDAVYNHQPHIPAINGMRGFHTKDQARKAAELVVYKIKNNVMPPSVSPQELDSIGALK